MSPLSDISITMSLCVGGERGDLSVYVVYFFRLYTLNFSVSYFGNSSYKQKLVVVFDLV